MGATSTLRVANKVTRLATIPRQLPTPSAEREVVLDELMTLRRALSVSAARVRCNRESIVREAGQIERVVAELKLLAERA